MSARATGGPRSRPFTLMDNNTRTARRAPRGRRKEERDGDTSALRRRPDAGCASPRPGLPARRGLAAAAVLLLGPALGCDRRRAGPLPSARPCAASSTRPTCRRCSRCPGEPVTLRYDVYCPPPEGAATDECDAAGTVYVRAGDAGAFRPFPLQLDRHAAEGRWAARVPADIARSRAGFSYYAVLRNRAAGTPDDSARRRRRCAAAHLRGDRAASPWSSARTRSGAPARPRRGRSRPSGATGRPTPGSRAAVRPSPVGPGSFVVGADGTSPCSTRCTTARSSRRPGARRPARVPLDINGTLADLAGGGDGDALGAGDGRARTRRC